MVITSENVRDFWTFYSIRDFVVGFLLRSSSIACVTHGIIHGMRSNNFNFVLLHSRFFGKKYSKYPFQTVQWNRTCFSRYFMFFFPVIFVIDLLPCRGI